MDKSDPPETISFVAENTGPDQEVIGQLASSRTELTCCFGQYGIREEIDNIRDGERAIIEPRNTGLSNYHSPEDIPDLKGVLQ